MRLGVEYKRVQFCPPSVYTIVEVKSGNATINNDNELRIKVSKEWSELNGVEITPEMTGCSGCRIPGVKTVYCDFLCAAFHASAHINNSYA